MSSASKIEWTEATWNPIVGCSIVSPGCTNCYAMRMAARIERMGSGPHYAGTTRKVNGKSVWTGKLAMAPEHILLEPLRRQRPTMYFVNSMSDLFHEDVPFKWVDRVFAVMALCPQHTFQVLTKRSGRMREYLAGATARFGNELLGAYERIYNAMGGLGETGAVEPHPYRRAFPNGMPWPLPNVWLGVSAERQQEANARIPDLLATPAAVRFVSAEPLLGPIDFTALRDDGTGIDDSLRGLVLCQGRNEPAHTARLSWIIVGGESGAGARALWVPNVRSIVRQCRKAGVPVFVKQLGAYVTDRNDAGFEGCDPHEWPIEFSSGDRIEHDLDGTLDGYQGAPVRIRLRHRKGADMAEWPEGLRVREMPTARGATAAPQAAEACA